MRLLLVALVAGVVVCTHAALTPLQKLGQANNEFAYTLYKKLVTTMKDDPQPGNGNIFYGPLSLYTALSMLYLGAGGSTKTQMEQVLRFENIGANFHESFRDLNALLFAANNNYTLKSANKLFPDATFNDNIKQSFKTDTGNYYGASLETKDFKNNAETARQEINEWVEQQTAEKIKDLLPAGSVDSMTILVLVNAMYFKGAWTYPFLNGNTQARDFYTSDNDEDKVSMDFMYQTKKFNINVNADKKVKVLEMPYAGDMSMYIVLPDEREGLEDLESSMNIELMNELLNDADFNAANDVKVYLPKFKLAQKFDLENTFKDLGLKQLFSDSADLTGIADAKLAVSAIKHKAFIDVNEEGTEAAASTGIGISLTSFNPDEITFNADHPFMFLIREKTTGVILFMGSVKEQPSESAVYEVDPAKLTQIDDDDDDVTGSAMAQTAFLLTVFLPLLLIKLF